MKHRLLALAISLAILTAVTVNQNAAAQADARSQERIAREVRHELLMLPWFGVFDYIAFKVDGGTVTLMGQVVRPSLKSDAENALKRIEGGPELLVPRALRSHRSGIAPCSTLGFVCFPRIAPRSTFSPLALLADLTRLSTLGALRLLRIAPLSSPCARAGHGSPRATDCSVFST